MEIEASIHRFYHNLLCLRLAFGMSQAQMAEVLGISVGTLRKIERGIRTPKTSAVILWKASNAFRISTDVLLKVDFQEPADPNLRHSERECP